MDPKKLDLQEAFNLVTNRLGKELPEALEDKDVEAGFNRGGALNPTIQGRSPWLRYLIWGSLAIITCEPLLSVSVSNQRLPTESP